MPPKDSKTDAAPHADIEPPVGVPGILKPKVPTRNVFEAEPVASAARQKVDQMQSGLANALRNARNQIDTVQRTLDGMTDEERAAWQVLPGASESQVRSALVKLTAVLNEFNA